MSGDDFLLKQDRAHRLAHLRGEMENGKHLSRDDLAEVFADNGQRVCNRILAQVRAKQSTGAQMAEVISQVVKEVMAISFVNLQKRQSLERRILNLEEEIRSLRQPTKPRLVSVTDNQDGAGLRAGRAG